MSKNIVFFYTRDRYLIKIQDFNIVKVFQDLEKNQSKPSGSRRTRARSGVTSLVVSILSSEG